MRITNAQINAIMNDALSHNAAKTGKLMQQMATGDRIILPSDDPISSVRLLRIAREESSLAQYQLNIGNLSGRLSAAETNLESVSDTMLNVRDSLLLAANVGVHSPADLASIAGAMSSLEDTIVSYINARDEEGRYVFSGTQTDKPALIPDANPAAVPYYTLGGNDKYRQVAVANDVLVDDNVNATQVLGTTVDMLNKLHALVANLQDPALDPLDPAVHAEIADNIVALDLTMGGLLRAVSDLGGRQNTLSLLKDTQADVSLVNQKIEGELSALDYASASLDLANYKMALQATQKTYLQINGLTLFDLM